MNWILIGTLAAAAMLLLTIIWLLAMGRIGESGDALEQPDFETWRRETFDRWQDNRVRTLHARDAE